MNWISIEKELPPPYKRILAVVQYLDAVFDMNTGGYDENKTFWTDPIITITLFHKDLENISHVECGGKITYWMPLPELPEELYEE